MPIRLAGAGLALPAAAPPSAARSFQSPTNSHMIPAPVSPATIPTKKLVGNLSIASELYSKIRCLPDVFLGKMGRHRGRVESHFRAGHVEDPGGPYLEEAAGKLRSAGPTVEPAGILRRRRSHACAAATTGFL